MTDQVTDQAKTPRKRIGEIARKAFIWFAIGLGLYTLFRMAGKKFGWF